MGISIEWGLPIILLLVVLVWLLAASKTMAAIRSKNYKTFQVARVLIVGYFLYKAIQTGDKFDYAFVVIFIVAIVEAAYKRKRDNKPE